MFDAFYKARLHKTNVDDDDVCNLQTQGSSQNFWTTI